MSSFIVYLCVMSFTPGPNTVLAMSEGQHKRFRGALPFNLGIAGGLILLCVVAGLLTGLLTAHPWAITAMKVSGSTYLLYLAYHMALATNNIQQTTGLTTPIRAGALLQLTNIKAYLYCITSLTGFVPSTHFPLGLIGKSAFIIAIGLLGTLTWSAAGALLRNLFNRYSRPINTVVALLLVFAAYDLWR